MAILISPNKLVAVAVVERKKFPNNSIVIFNRWGQQVFTAKPYGNDRNGTYKGGPLPAGTYYYLLNLEGEDESVWGNILLLR